MRERADHQAGQGRRPLTAPSSGSTGLGGCLCEVGRCAHGAHTCMHTCPPSAQYCSAFSLHVALWLPPGPPHTHHVSTGGSEVASACCYRVVQSPAPHYISSVLILILHFPNGNGLNGIFPGFEISRASRFPTGPSLPFPNQVCLTVEDRCLTV